VQPRGRGDQRQAHEALWKTRRKMRDRRFRAPLDGCLSGIWIASRKRPAGQCRSCRRRGCALSFAKFVLVSNCGYRCWIFRLRFGFHEYGQSIRRSPHRFTNTCDRVSLWLDHFLLCRRGFVGAWCRSLAACRSRTCSGARNEIVAIRRKDLNPRKIKPSAPTLDGAASTT